MGTAATVSKVHVSDAVGGTYIGIFELTLDTTDGSGLMTVDLTDYFEYIWSIEIGHSDAAAFYNVEAYCPDPDTAIAATTVGLGFSEAGGDGAVLDLMATTNMAAEITGLKIVVHGTQAI